MSKNVFFNDINLPQFPWVIKFYLFFTEPLTLLNPDVAYNTTKKMAQKQISLIEYRNAFLLNAH